MNWEIEKLKQERQKQKKRQSLHQVTIAYSNLKKSNQERKNDDYIDYLQQENRKLLGTLTKQRQQYQKKTIRFQQIIREKDLLLEQCQREIGLVKKQYQIISKGEGGQRKSKKKEFQVKPNHKLLEKISDI